MSPHWLSNTLSATLLRIFPNFSILTRRVFYARLTAPQKSESSTMMNKQKELQKGFVRDANMCFQKNSDEPVKTWTYDDLIIFSQWSRLPRYTMA